jgi:DNA-binding MarR family transcriptional regulator
MSMSIINQQLLLTQQKRNRSWGKIIYQLKKQLDAWAKLELASYGHHHFKTAHLPFIMNINVEGITNNELAKIVGISKQGMSKVVKELQQLSYITLLVDKKDKRSAHIFLTPKGKKFVLRARQRIAALEVAYQKEIGKKNFEQLKDSLLKIVLYNQSQ